MDDAKLDSKDKCLQFPEALYSWAGHSDGGVKLPFLRVGTPRG